MLPIPRRRLTVVATVAILALLTGVAPLQAAPVEVPAYEATYQLEAAGMTVASAHVRLSYEPERLVYAYDSEARGLMALFRDDHVVERTVMEKTGEGRYRSLEYSYDHTGGKRDDHDRVHFDWGADLASGRFDGQEFSCALAEQPAPTDRLAVQLILMTALANGRQPETYPVVDKGRIKTYEFRYLGREALDTAIGMVDTVVVERRRGDSSRITTTWFAADHDYLPVRVEQRKTGKDDKVVMVIEHVTWH